MMMKYLVIIFLFLPILSQAGYVRHHDCEKFEKRVLTLINKQSIQIELLKKRLLKIEPELVTIPKTKDIKNED